MPAALALKDGEEFAGDLLDAVPEQTGKCQETEGLKESDLLLAERPGCVEIEHAAVLSQGNPHASIKA
uniref:hypothetical protein n=1 Tax=Cephaloticoccus sp. TaxID=1985742 RepID=UPI00404B41CC